MSRLGGMLVTRGEVIPVDEQLRRWERVGPPTSAGCSTGCSRAAEPITVSVGPGSLTRMPVGSRHAVGSRSKALLAAYGVPIVDERLAADPDEAVAMAAGLGFPVVLKLNGDAIAHKTERGLVRLGLADAGCRPAGRHRPARRGHPRRRRGVAARRADGRRDPGADGRPDTGPPVRADRDARPRRRARRGHRRRRVPAGADRHGDGARDARRADQPAAARAVPWRSRRRSGRSGRRPRGAGPARRRPPGHPQRRRQPVDRHPGRAPRGRRRARRGRW